MGELFNCQALGLNLAVTQFTNILFQREIIGN